MAKFRKKPVVIDAEQWFPGVKIGGVTEHKTPTCIYGRIHTLEGTMTVSKGDWVITGIKGEKYPCKPDIFEATYEPIQEDVKTGMRVRTNKVLGKTDGMFVKPRHLKARRPDSEGVVHGYVPGHGGDCWWVKHEDTPDGSGIGAYCFDEFELVRGGEKNDNEYRKRREKCLYEELKHIYPDLALPDERTPEEKKRDAEQDVIDLFGPEEEKEKKHAYQGTD